MPQADVQNIVRLNLRQVKARNQRLFGLISLADDGDHLVNIQQHNLAALQDVNARQHFAKPVLRAAHHGALAELHPLGQHLLERLLRGPPIQPNHCEVDRRGALQTGVRQQCGDELLLPCAAGFGLAHQAHGCVFVGLVAHHVEYRQQRGFGLDLLQRQRLFTDFDLGVGQLFNLFEHLLRADTRWQFSDHQLPLAARQFLDLPAGTHFERATTGAVGLQNVAGRADDLPATGIVRAGDDGQQVFIRQRRVFDHRHTRISHFAQVVTGDFSRQAHRNATGPVEQGKRQARRQLARLVGRAIVIGGEIDRALVDFVHQEAGDLGQTRLGVAHRRRTIAIAAAEVALAIDQRVALRKILRHAHQRVVGRLVAVWVKAAQHIAHYARTFDRSGRAVAASAAKPQAHTRHRIEDAPLDGLEAVAHIGQCAAFDDAQRIFKVSTLRVGGQIQVRVVNRVACRIFGGRVLRIRKEIGSRWIAHC